MEIKPASTHHETALKQLLQSCNLPFEDLRPAHLEHFWVAENTAQLEAVIGLEICAEFGLLRSLAVTPARRGQGLGHRLVEKIENHARSLQISALYLLTTTADRFFARLGYQIVERASVPAPLQATAEFQSICPDSAVCMRKDL